MSRPVPTVHAVPTGHEGLVLGGGLRLALTVLGPKRFVTSFVGARASKAPTRPSRRMKRARAA